jgi:hypothetical protein
MSGPHHAAGAECPLCDFKLKQAHPYMVDWFHSLKKKYINVHVAWAWRDQTDQNQCFLDGKTKLQWPFSPHNHMKDDQPFSLALDLFQEDEDGVARWSKPFFTKVNDENEAANEPIRWGGKFKTLGDSNHFQYNAF